MGVCTVTKKIVNHLKPFSVTMQPLIQDILDKEKIVEKYAGMATMERIKGVSSTAFVHMVFKDYTALMGASLIQHEL